MKDFKRIALLISASITMLSFSCNDVPRTVSQISINSIEIDTVMVSPAVYSGDGFYRLNLDKLYFFDKIFLTVSEISSTGIVDEIRLGKGEKNNEVSDFMYGGFLSNGKPFFIDRGYNIFIYSNAFEKENSASLNWDRKKNQYDDSDYKKKETYSLKFLNNPYSNNYLPTLNYSVYFPLWISPNVNPYLNGYVQVKKYFNNTFSVGKSDLKTGNILGIFGTKKQEGIKHLNVPNFDFCSLFIHKDVLYVSKPLDPLIQLYSILDDHELIKQFGQIGNKMIIRPVKTFTPNQAEEDFRQSYINQSYYYSIYVDDDYIFRSYSRNSKEGGMQIFEGETLIADLTVPKRFNVIGKIEGYYIADGLIEDDILGFYKFKIK